MPRRLLTLGPIHTPTLDALRTGYAVTEAASQADALALDAAMRGEIEAMRALLLVGGFSLDKAHEEAGADAEFWEARANLLIPVIGVATFTHIFHKLGGQNP